MPGKCRGNAGEMPGKCRGNAGEMPGRDFGAHIPRFGSCWGFRGVSVLFWAVLPGIFAFWRLFSLLPYKTWILLHPVISLGFWPFCGLRRLLGPTMRRRLSWRNRCDYCEILACLESKHVSLGILLCSRFCGMVLSCFVRNGFFWKRFLQTGRFRKLLFVKGTP